MSYRITIIKTEPNPRFAEELEAYNEGRKGYGMIHRDDQNYPQEEVKKNALLVELTDEQYKKVKAEIIKTFE